MLASSILSRNNISIALVVGAVLFGLWFFSDIVTYLVISLVLSAILRVPTNYMTQMQFFGVRVPRFLAILLSFAALAAIIALFALLFAPLVMKQIEVLANINYTELADNALIPVKYLEEKLIEHNILKNKGSLMESIRENMKNPLADVSISSFVNNFLSFTSSFFIGFLATLFITFFILNEKGALRRYFLSIIPNKYFEVSITAVIKIERLLSNYLLGILLQMISIFSLASFGLIMVGVEYAVTIAAFAAVANLIPYLGPMMGTVFGVIVGLSTNTLIEPEEYSALMLRILGVFGTVQLIDNMLLQPIIFSRSVKAHPLEIFLIIFVGATLNGAMGMVLAIPFYTIAKVTFLEFYGGYRQYRIFRE